MADYEVQYDPERGDWSAKRDGAERASSRHDTQAQAQAAARDLANSSGGGEVRVHRKHNNEIRDSNTYGKPDPRRSKG